MSDHEQRLRERHTERESQHRQQHARTVLRSDLHALLRDLDGARAERDALLKLLRDWRGTCACHNDDIGSLIDAALREAQVERDALCPHGKPIGECNACDVASDFAFDAARETRTFGR